MHSCCAVAPRASVIVLPNARTMIHQPSGGAQGQATDIDIQAKEILIIRETLNQLMAEHTGQPLEVIERDTERDRFMNAEQSKAYGLVDEVVTSSGRCRRE